jgi:hypothetical protein
VGVVADDPAVERRPERRFAEVDLGLAEVGLGAGDLELGEPALRAEHGLELVLGRFVVRRRQLPVPPGLVDLEGGDGILLEELLLALEIILGVKSGRPGLAHPLLGVLDVDRPQPFQGELGQGQGVAARRAAGLGLVLFLGQEDLAGPDVIPVLDEFLGDPARPDERERDRLLAHDAARGQDGVDGGRRPDRREDGLDRTARPDQNEGGDHEAQGRERQPTLLVKFRHESTLCARKGDNYFIRAARRRQRRGAPDAPGPPVRILGNARAISACSRPGSGRPRRRPRRPRAGGSR